MSLFWIKKQKTQPPTTTTDHWIALEISFSCGLDNLFQWILPKITRLNSTYMPNFYNSKVISMTINVKSFQWKLMLFESKVRLGYFTYFPWRQRLKQIVRFHSHTNLQQIYFVSSNYSNVFQTSTQVQRKFPYFKILLTVQLRSFHLTFHSKWLICNIMTCKRKTSGEKNLINSINAFQAMNMLN